MATHASHQEWFASVCEAADKTPVGEVAKSINMSVGHTGGGCLAFTLNQDPDFYAMLTDGDNGLPETLQQQNCYLGIYDNDGQPLFEVLSITPWEAFQTIWTAFLYAEKSSIANEVFPDVEDWLKDARAKRVTHPDEDLAIDCILNPTPART